MYDGAGIPLNRSILINPDRACGARWGKGANRLHFQMRSFLVLTTASAPIKQVGKHAIWGLFFTQRRHHKPPLRGGRVTAVTAPTALGAWTQNRSRAVRLGSG